jgi:hypothetical protein
MLVRGVSCTPTSPFSLTCAQPCMPLLQAFRDNDRLAVNDAQLAQHLWTATGLAAAFDDMRLGGGAAPTGLNPNIRIYKYSAGQRFGRHIDESNECGALGTTRFTLLIYLSACSGGETVFYGGRNRMLAAVSPEPGLALLHLHGEDCLEHEGRAVRAGVKYVLRSDVCFARHGR